MGAASDYLQNKLLDHVFKVGAYAQPTHIFIALCKSTVDKDDTGSTLPGEVSGGDYRRVTCDEWAPATGTNTYAPTENTIAFPLATTDWGRVSNIAICDDATGGNVLTFGRLYDYKDVVAGDQMEFEAGGITVGIDNISSGVSVLIHGHSNAESHAVGTASGPGYWVSPTGASAWLDAYGSVPLSGSSCCSLATANANAVGGDTVFLRGGTYNTSLDPDNSGTLADRITFKAHTGETPVIKNTADNHNYYYHGILLSGVSYIVIDGVDVDNPISPEVPADFGYPLIIINGAHHNEIKNFDINGNGAGRINLWRGNVGNDPVTNNWIHDGIIRNLGHLYASGESVYTTMGLQIGIPSYDDASGNNTIENVVLSWGGHHNIETFSQYNVIKNCYLHNEGFMANNTGKTPIYGPDESPPAASANRWGHRNIQIYNETLSNGTFTLLEGNRFGHSGPPPENDGGDGMTICADKNIIRFNDVFNSQNNGVLFKTGGETYAKSDNNRFYNNTIYKSGRYENTGPDWQGYSFRWYGSYERTGNVIINNIMNTYGGALEMNTNTGSNTIANNYLTSDGDPLFTNTSVADVDSPTLPNLSIQAGSECIGAGTHLTHASGSGSGSTILVVLDALFFQDGTWGSDLTHGVTLFPDWIAIGTVGNIVEIESINYSTNTITLASAMTWSNNDSVWLYKNSDGDRVLYGSAPEIGAHPVVS